MGILTSLDSDFSWFVAMGVSDTGKINGSKRERMKKGKKKKCENFHKNRKNENYVLINIYCLMKQQNLSLFSKLMVSSKWKKHNDKQH